MPYPDTYTPIPGSDYLEGLRQLHAMLAPDAVDDQGGLSKAGQSAETLQSSPVQSSVANDPNISTAYLRDKFQGEALDHLAGALGAGDRNEAARQGVYLKDYDRQEAEDPTSYTNAGKDALLDQTSRNAAQRTMGSAEMAARAQQIKEAGQLKESEAYGGTYGTARGQNSAPAQSVADAASHRKITEELASQRAMAGQKPEGPFAGENEMGGGGSGNPTAKFLAQQVHRDPSLMNMVPPAMKNQVAMEMANMGGDVEHLTNQTRQMSEGAFDILKVMPEAKALAKELSDAGLMQPVVGTVRTWLAGKGATGIAQLGPEWTQKINRFNSVTEALKSGFARAHAGARGAGNSQMAERFDKLAPVQGDINSFLGGLDGMADMLKVYAGHTHSADDVNALDPMSNPNYVHQ